MRIIVDNGAYTLRNMGDVAMLQVTIRRIREAYPEAQLHVLTSEPQLLNHHCPGTLPLSVASRNSAYARTAKDPRNLRTFWRKLRGRKVAAPNNPGEFKDVFASVDAVVVAGGGFLNDLNANATFAVLSTLAEAVSQGKRVALFGQGLGPMRKPSLIELLGKTLREGAWLGLRESRRGPAIATEAGALAEQVAVTGDDAIEPALDMARGSPANVRQALGVSVRKIEYSAVDRLLLERLAEALQLLKQRLEVRFVPVPISFNSYENDPQVIESLTWIESSVSETPEAVIRATAQTRIVFTGTYHAAVFALAQGIPCVCFFASEYYRDKLEGLAEQFGTGCVLVDFTKASAAREAAAKAEELWQNADAYREPLLRAAEKQVAAGKAFYTKALRI